VASVSSAALRCASAARARDVCAQFGRAPAAIYGFGGRSGHCRDIYPRASRAPAPRKLGKFRPGERQPTVIAV